MRHFTPTDLKDYLRHCEQTPFLLDVREPWEFAYCHIEGSELIPMGHIQHEAGNFDPSRETVVICHHGIRSRQVAYYLESLGFESVINLDGGVERWAQEVDPTMKRY